MVDLQRRGPVDSTLEITAEEEDGEVTGEARITPYDPRSPLLVVRLECADTDTDGVVILGGEATSASRAPRWVGAPFAVIIREGDPDSVGVWPHSAELAEAAGREFESESCGELLESIPEDVLTNDFNFTDVLGGDDIETG